MTRSLELVADTTAFVRPRSTMKSPASIKPRASSQEETQQDIDAAMTVVDELPEGGSPTPGGAPSNLGSSAPDPEKLSRKCSLRRRLSNSSEYKMGCVRANFALDKLGNRTPPVVRFSREVKSASFHRVPSMLLPTAQTRMFPDLAQRLRASGRPIVIPNVHQTSLELSTRARSAVDVSRTSYDPDKQSTRSSVISRLISISSSMSSLTSDIGSDALPIQEGQYLDTFADVASVKCKLEQGRKRRASRDTNPEPASNPFDEIQCPECRKLLQERGRMDQFVKAWLAIVETDPFSGRLIPGCH